MNFGELAFVAPAPLRTIARMQLANDANTEVFAIGWLASDLLAAVVCTYGKVRLPGAAARPRRSRAPPGEGADRARRSCELAAGSARTSCCPSRRAERWGAIGGATTSRRPTRWGDSATHSDRAAGRNRQGALRAFPPFGRPRAARLAGDRRLARGSPSQRSTSRRSRFATTKCPDSRPTSRRSTVRRARVGSEPGIGTSRAPAASRRSGRSSRTCWSSAEAPRSS